jgi:hypothetical protein
MENMGRPGVAVHAYNPTTWELEMGGLWSEAGPRQNQDPIWKTNWSKKDTDLAQVVEHLTSNHKALEVKP